MDLTKFDKYVEDGLISRKVSPCGKLVLFDYTEKCQYEKVWDEITLNARGSVYELSTGKIVARAFPKFFNFSELSEDVKQSLLSNNSFSVFEKLDGSLGIVYFYGGKWNVNTRGSFISDQAVKGLQLLTPYTKKLDPELTYLVEIIYPENRIVVDYNGEEKLVFLSSYHTERGSEILGSPFDRSAKQYQFENIHQVIDKLKTLPFNEEGYVVLFSNGQRAKFKGDEYIRMHRICTGTSPLTLWESMQNGKVSQELLQSIPEEFNKQYLDMAEKLELNFANLKNQVLDELNYIKTNILKSNEITQDTRKQLGLFLKSTETSVNKFIFPAFLGNEDGLNELIKKEIKPKANIL